MHGDHIAVLPKEAINHGSSIRTENEIYSIGDRIFCMQSHPEFNTCFI